MDLYRKKPVIVEARQVPHCPEHPAIDSYKGSLGEFIDECTLLAEWCGGRSFMMINNDERYYPDCEFVGPHIRIETLHGPVAARSGSWIVQGDKDFWPVDPDIFEATYELVDGTNSNT